MVGLWCAHGIHSQFDLVQCCIEHLIFKAVPLIFVFTSYTHIHTWFCPWGQEPNASYFGHCLPLTLAHTKNATIHKTVTLKIEANKNFKKKHTQTEKSNIHTLTHTHLYDKRKCVDKLQYDIIKPKHWEKANVCPDEHDLHLCQRIHII